MNEKDIVSLKEELAQFRKTVNRRLDEMESNLTRIDSQAAAPKRTYPYTKTEEKTLAKAPPVEISDTQFDFPPAKIERSPDKQAINLDLPPQEPWLKALFLKLAPIMFGWLEPILKMYGHYKKRGLGHVFLLTLGGIGLTLVGVGYLMQLMVEELNAGAKSLLFTGVSGAIIFGGFRLYKVTLFKEYAVALVAMGILIGYTTIYFSGNVYYLLPPLLTLVAYCFIAIGSHLLARKLDVNIIYSLGILGVALIPMLSAKDHHDGLWYLMSVCLVGCSSLWFAFKNQIRWLSGITLVAVFMASEWIGLADADTLLTMSTFFLLLLFQMGKACLSNDLKKMSPMLAGYIGSWATLLYQSSGDVSHLVLALSAASHALLAGYLAYYYKSQSKLFQTIFTLMSALWLCIFAVFILGQAYWGLAWLVEGAFLLYLSSRLNLKHAFVSAQCLIAVAIVYNFVALFPYLPLPALHTFDGWVLSFSILAGLSFWVRQLQNAISSMYQLNRVQSLLYLCEAAWVCFLVLATCEYWITHWLTPLVVLLQAGLLLWSKFLKEKLIEFLAIGLTAIPINIAIIAFNDANSFFIGDIAWPARVAVITVFLQMWGWSEFHRRYLPGSAFSKYSEGIRLAFYLLLPIAGIGSAYRMMDEAMISILWHSPLIALGLAVTVKHTALIIETKLLTIILGILLLFATAFLNWTYVLPGILGYVALFVCIYTCKYHLNAAVQVPSILSWMAKLMGLIFPVFLGIQTASIFIAIATASVYWLLFYVNPTSMVLLRLNRNSGLWANRLMFFISLAAMMMEPWLLVVIVVYSSINIVFYQDKFIYFSMTNWHKNIQRHMLLALSYSLFLVALHSHQALLFFGPLLAIHGVFVVLQDRSHPSVTKLGFGLLALGILKIAILDVNTTELWQKVLMFIGIGCFLLLASFWYQKLIMKYNDANVKLD